MPESQHHFRGHHYQAQHITGPIKSLNPTKRYIAADKSSVSTPETRQDTESGFHAAYVWRSRDNRKGRHALAVSHNPQRHDAVTGPRLSNTWAQTWRGLGKMVTRYPVWDISYDVALVFTVGSIIWVINGFFAWLPLQTPSTEFHGETDWGGGLTAFIGATVFEFGSVLLMLEAVNENRSDCFGWAVEETFNGIPSIRPAHGCSHSHAQKRTFIAGQADQRPTYEGRAWSWWPTWRELRTHYFRDIGFLACSSQMFGATIFWISGITALPPILNNLSKPAENGVYWVPQVVGGTGFIVSATLFMVEVQPRWYMPAPGVLGWHIGLWNLIGAIGFTLCGALGFAISEPAVEYALTLSTFIGSWAFLVGSAIQWFESLNKYPIWIDKKTKTTVTNGS